MNLEYIKHGVVVDYRGLKAGDVIMFPHVPENDTMMVTAKGIRVRVTKIEGHAIFCTTIDQWGDRPIGCAMTASFPESKVIILVEEA